MIKPIEWDQLPRGKWTDEVVEWDDADKELATIAVRLYQHLAARLEGQEPMPVGSFEIAVKPFVKVPSVADGLAMSLWYADLAARERVRQVVGTAIALTMQASLEEFFK